MRLKVKHILWRFLAMVGAVAVSVMVGMAVGFVLGMLLGE